MPFSRFLLKITVVFVTFLREQNGNITKGSSLAGSNIAAKYKKFYTACQNYCVCWKKLN